MFKMLKQVNSLPCREIKKKTLSYKMWFFSLYVKVQESKEHLNTQKEPIKIAYYDLILAGVL